MLIYNMERNCVDLQHGKGQIEKEREMQYL